MDRERAKELLPIIQAFAEGKTIQRNDRIMRDDSLNKWYDTDDITGKGEYRIKPEPRTWWINTDNGTAMGASDGWKPAVEKPSYVKVREVLDGD